MIAEAALTLLEKLYAKSTRASWKRNNWCVYALTDAAYLDIARFVSVSDAEFTIGVHAILPDLIHAIRDLQAQLQAKDDELLAQAALVVELRAEVDGLRADAELGAMVRQMVFGQSFERDRNGQGWGTQVWDDELKMWMYRIFDTPEEALRKKDEVQP